VRANAARGRLNIPVDQHAGMQKRPPRRWGLLGGHMC